MFKLGILSIFSIWTNTVFAQAAAQPQGPSMFEMVVPFIGIFAVMYFFMIRPQQMRAKEHQAFLSALKAGDEIVTSGGIIGRVRSVAEGFVSVEIAGDTVIKVLKSAIEGQSPKAQQASSKS